MPNSPKCRHGSIDLGKDKAKYQDALRTIFQLIERHTAKTSRSFGHKMAGRFMTNYPDLVNEEMVAFLVRTGTTMILTNNQNFKIIIQAIAELTGRLEKTLRGHTTMKHDLRLKKDPDGHKRAKTHNLKRFFRKRIPCSCLDKNAKKQKKKEKKTCCTSERKRIPCLDDKKSQKQKQEKMACCSFGPCSERKALKRLFICAGCMAALYCCAECQQNDWKSHSMVCTCITDNKGEATRMTKDKTSVKEDHTETTESDWWSEAESETWEIKETDTPTMSV